MSDVDRNGYRLDAQLLGDLWVFHVAARLNSITAAAQHLNVTQGAVSQRVLRLEARLGMELFRRHKGRIAPNEAGLTVLEAMNAVSDGLGQALGRLGRSRNALVVSCGPSLATEWLMPHLRDFYRDCPGIELLVRAEIASPSRSRMLEDHIDVLIDYQHAPAAELHELASVQELTFPVCSRAYRDRLRSLAPAERDFVLMHDDDAWQEGEASGAEWQEWRDTTGSAARFSVKGARHFNLAYLAYQAAMYGQGLAIGRSISVNRLIHSGDLVAAFDLPPVASAHYRVLSLAPVAEETPTARFAQWVCAAMRNSQKDTLERLALA